MGVSWDWFKSPESMEHPWERFKSLQPRWLKWPSVLLYPTSLGTILSQVTKQYASVTSDHQSTSLLITKSDKIVPRVMFHTLFYFMDHIKWKNAPVISHYQSKSLPIIMSPAAMSTLLLSFYLIKVSSCRLPSYLHHWLYMLQHSSLALRMTLILCSPASRVSLHGILYVVL